MKILVLGASGMAGHLISLYFKENGYDITAFTRKPFKYCKNILGDAFNAVKLKKVLLSDDYDVVINCIGLLNQDAENNKSEAIYLNAYLPHFVSQVLSSKKTKLIHMSTDCVFAGNTGPYYEDSIPDGQTYYDKTKALGEINDKKHLTFRNSIIGPDTNPKGIGLFNWFMAQNGTINGYTNAIWTGVTTLTLAKAMEQAIKEDLSGIYHLVNNETISKHQLLKLFNKYFKENQLVINKYSDFTLDKTLISNRTDLSFKVPSYEEMIIEMKNWIIQHPKLYTNYNTLL